MSLRMERTHKNFASICPAKCIILFFLSFSHYSVHSQDTIKVNYEFEYGTNPNIESGAQSAISASSFVIDWIDESLRKEVKSKPLNAAGRLLNFGLIGLWLAVPVYATFPHEFFGHHNVAAKFGIHSTVSLDFPSYGGKTYLNMAQSVPALDRQMIMAAGPEVTATIAYKATQQLYSNPLAPFYIGNYLVAGKFIDQYYYYHNAVVPFMRDPNKYIKANAAFLQANPVPDDPIAYMLALTESYGYYPFMDKGAIWLQQFPDMSVYTQNVFIKDQSERMRKAYLLTALDPTNLYFLYGNGLYLISGKTFFKPFMIRLGKVSFMPSVRANMGELGVENYFDIYFKVENLPPFSIYYRNGGNMFDKLHGGGLDVRNMRLTDCINLSGQIDYWLNGRMHEHEFNLTTTVAVWNKKHNLSALFTPGYKTRGNLMGKPFYQGAYLYLGVGFNLQRSGSNWRGS